MIAAIRKESKVYSAQNYTKCAPVTGKKLLSSWFTLHQKQRTLFIYKLCIINWQLVNYFRIDISDTADKLQYQTQNISEHLQFLITLVQLTQDSFGCTNTHSHVHTYSLFGLQVHCTEHDKAHTSVHAHTHTPVRMVPGLKCTSPSCGYPWYLRVHSLCMVFKSKGCVGILIHFLAVAFL